MPAAGSHCVSPELALVCPELRAAAIAALPERDPDGFLPRTSRSAPEYRLLRAVAAPEPRRHVRLPVAVLAYATRRAAFVVVETAVVLGFVAGAFALAAAVNS